MVVDSSWGMDLRWQHRFCGMNIPSGRTGLQQSRLSFEIERPSCRYVRILLLICCHVFANCHFHRGHEKRVSCIHPSFLPVAPWAGQGKRWSGTLSTQEQAGQSRVVPVSGSAATSPPASTTGSMCLLALCAESPFHKGSRQWPS